MLKLAIGGILGIVTLIGGYFGYTQQTTDENLGTAVRTFTSEQLATSPVAGYVLSSLDGVTNAWIAMTGGGGGGGVGWATTTNNVVLYNTEGTGAIVLSSNDRQSTGTMAYLNVSGGLSADWFLATNTASSSLFTGGMRATASSTISSLTVTTGTTTNGTSTTFRTTTLGVGSDYLTDITGAGLQITGNALTLNATGDWTGTLDGFEGATLAQTNWLFNGSRLSPSTTVGIGVFSSSTITDLSMTNATITNGTSTNLSVSGSLKLFGGTSVTSNNALCILLTGTADLCDGNDASGGGSALKAHSWYVDADGAGDYTTIQGALDQCAVVGGGSIYLTDPYYFIGGTGIVFKSNDCQVIGIYASTTIEVSGATTAFKTNSAASTYANVGVQNVVIVGDGTAGSVGIDMSDMIRSRYTGIIMDNLDIGFKLDDTQNVSFYNTVRDFAITTMGTYGIYASSTNPTNDNKFSDGFIGCTAGCTGIHLNNAQANSFTNVSIEPATQSGTIGVKIDVSNSGTNNGTFANKFTNLYAEANGVGVAASTTIGTKIVLGNTFDGGEIVANGVDVVDSSNGNGAVQFNGAIVNYEIANMFATTTMTFATTTKLKISGSLFDTNGNTGSSGQVLTSTGTSTLWKTVTGGSGSKWTDGTNFTYLTNTTYDLALGSNATETAPFWWDVSATTSYIGNGGAGDSVLTFGPTGSEWTMGFDDTDDSFRIASSTSLGNFDFLKLFSTTTLTYSSSTLGGLAPESAVRAVFGSFNTASIGYNPLDQINLNGRVNTGDWVNNDCAYPSALAGTALSADTANICGSGYMFQEDTTGTLTFTKSDGVPTMLVRVANALANDGAGVFLMNNATAQGLNPASSTPVIEVVARIDTPANASNTRIMIGFPTETPNSSTFESVKGGCYFVTASSSANWQFTCGGSQSTWQDTGIASTTSQTAGLNQFYKFRVWYSAGIGYGQITTRNNISPVMQGAATNVEVTPAAYLTTIVGGGGNRGIEIKRMNLWYKISL